MVGRPDEILSERVVAFVRARDPALDAGELERHCKSAMASYKVPDQFVIGADELPRNANGKIQKSELREIAKALPAARRSAQAGDQR